MERLRQMKKFRNGVPRGAQTWNAPCTFPTSWRRPDGSHLHAGLRMTGDPDFLEQARYWAWTGVPLCISSIRRRSLGPLCHHCRVRCDAVEGPVWLGCGSMVGLVYADALHRLVRDDPTGP